MFIKYKKFIQFKTNEIIFINNGSNDNSKKVLNKLKKKNVKIVNIKKNIGFGNGLHKGLLKASGKFIICSHADPEVDPKDIFKCISVLNKKKTKNKIFIKGQRINKIKNNWSFLDIFFSYGLTLFSSILFQKKLYDIHAQPVLFSRALIKKINYFPKDFTIDLCIYFHAIKEKYEIIRFPVNFNKKSRIYGSGSSDTLIKKLKGTMEQLINSILLRIKIINPNI